MTAQTKRSEQAVDQTSERIRDFNERLLDSGRRVGETYLDAYERTAHSVANFQDRLGAASQVEWVASLAHAQADLTREASDVYTRTARTVLADRS